MIIRAAVVSRPGRKPAMNSFSTLWFASIGLYEQQVENIAKGLAAADPSHEQQYESNAKEYCGKLDRA